MRITDHLAHWANANNITKSEIVARIVDELKEHKNLPKKERTKALLQKIDSIHAEADMGPVSCRKGCSSCCHQPIRLVDEELDLIIEYVKVNDIKINLKKLEQQNRFQPNDYFEYPDKESACVFLGVDGACRIYPVRPSTCRNYHVTSPPENCKNKHKGNRKNFPVNVGINGDAQFVACAIYNLSDNDAGILAQKLYSRVQMNKEFS